MDFKQMEYLIMVHQTNSLTKAASNLFISPQALSKSIKNLEKEWHETIMVRTGNTIEFTDFGNYLVDEAQYLIAQYRTFSQNIKTYQQLRKPQIRLSAITNSSTILGYDFFGSFRHQNPSISLSISEYDDLEVDKQIQNGDCDLALCVNRPEHPDHFQVYTLKHCFLGCIISPEHPLVNKTTLTLKDIAEYPILTRTENFKTYHDLERETFNQDIHLNYCLKTPDDWAWTVLIRDNTTVAIVLDCIKPSPNYRIYTLSERIPWELNLVINKHRLHRPYIQKLVNYILTKTKDKDNYAHGLTSKTI